MANVIDFMLRGSTASAERSLDRVGQRMNRLSGGVMRLAGSLGIAFGTAGMIAAARNSLQTADQMEKLERRLGITTEALSELKFAGEQSGIGFNTLTMGIQRMQRRVAEAAAGTGEARTALLELGLDAQKLAALKPDQQFELIAEAMSGVTNESDKTRLAMKLFDSEGVALLQTMTDGAAGVRELRTEARNLGLTLSKEDAVAAAEANDAFNRLQSSMNVLAREASINLAPGLADIANGMAEHLPGAVVIAQAAFGNLKSGLYDVIGVGATLVKQYAEMKSKVEGFFGNTEGAQEADLFAAQMENFAVRMKLRADEAGAESAAIITKHFETEGRKIQTVTANSVEEVASSYGRLSFAQAQAAVAAENMAAKAEVLGDSDFIAKLTGQIEVFGDKSKNVFGQIENSFKSTLTNMLNEMIRSDFANLFGSIFKGIGSGGSGGNSAQTGLIGGALKFLGFNDGGSFVVGQGMASSGTTADRRLIAVGDGERVDITPAGKRYQKKSGGAVVHIENHYDFTGAGGLSAPEVMQMVNAGNERMRQSIRKDIERGRF